MATNKVKFGLKNVHYAVEKDSLEMDPTKVDHEKPSPLLGGVSLSIEPSGDESPFYADDIKFYNVFTNQGYTGELELALIPDTFEQDVLGKSTTEETKLMVETTNDKTKRFALLFEIDGDVKARRYILYGCTASRPTTEAGTKTESTEPQTDTLAFTAAGLPDGTVKLVTTDQTPEDVYNKWFEKVWMKDDTASEAA